MLQSLLQEAVWVAVQPRRDDTIRILNPGATQYGWASCLELSVEDLASPASTRALYEQIRNGRWLSYILGSLYLLKSRYGWGNTGGVDLFIASELPPNKGVSSSAALEVATLKAVSAASEIRSPWRRAGDCRAVGGERHRWSGLRHHGPGSHRAGPAGSSSSHALPTLCAGLSSQAALRHWHLGHRFDGLPFDYRHRL